MNKRYIVYKTVNTITGNYYIGVHGQQKDDSYLGSGIRLKRQIAKYGRDIFVRETLYDFSSEAEAFEKEKAILIDCLKDSLCLNISPGGDGGPNFKGKTHSREVIERIAALNTYLEDRECAAQECNIVFHPKRSTQDFCSKKCVPLPYLSQKGVPAKPVEEETKVKIAQAMTGNKNAKGKPQGGQIASHNRWHVARNKKSEDCIFCNDAM